MMPTDLKKKQKKEDEELKYVKISNSLLECFVYKKNIIAIKIILFLSMRSNSIKKSKTDLTEINFSINSLINTIKVDKKTVLRNLVEIQKTSITFVNYVNDKLATQEHISIIPYLKLTVGKDDIQIKVFNQILDLIKDVENRFTIINVSNLIQLKNVNTIKMLGLLKIIDGYSQHVAKKKTYTLYELNSLFGVNYKNFYEFERKILKPVKEEIDNESKLTFFYDYNYEQVGRGRPSIKEIVIYLKNNENRQLKMF
jgi:hypothetical protein